MNEESLTCFQEKLYEMLNVFILFRTQLVGSALLPCTAGDLLVAEPRSQNQRRD